MKTRQAERNKKERENRDDTTILPSDQAEPCLGEEGNKGLLTIKLGCIKDIPEMHIAA